MPDISITSHFLFGFSCLNNKKNINQEACEDTSDKFLHKGDVRSQVQNHWNKRFQRDAIWIDVDPDKDNIQSIIKMVRESVTNYGIQDLASEYKHIIIAWFLDLSTPPESSWLDSVWNLQARIDGLFHTVTSIVLQFGYVGLLGIESAEQQRVHAAEIINRNYRLQTTVQHRLCLVAEPSTPNTEYFNWKAAIFLLDVLRRQQTPEEIMHNTADGNQNNDVIFLRYEEYDEKKRGKMQEDLSKSESLLNSSSTVKFTSALDEVMNDIRKCGEECFEIDGRFQPLHPGMDLSGLKRKLFCDPQRKAKKGRYKPYKDACEATKDAINATEERLQSDIEAHFQPRLDNAANELRELLKKASVKIKKDRALIEKLLLHENEELVASPKLELRYSEKGVSQEITDYLLAIRNIKLQEVQYSFRKKLWKAYKSIPINEFDKEEALLLEEIEETEKSLSKTPTPEDFCKKISDFSHELSFCSFALDHGPGGSNQKILVCRNQDQYQTAQRTVPNSVSVFYIPSRGGGIHELDGAPMKALQIVIMNATEDVLLQLLPEIAPPLNIQGDK